MGSSLLSLLGRDVNESFVGLLERTRRHHFLVVCLGMEESYAGYGCLFWIKRRYFMSLLSTGWF
jgi:hypothetical protein